MKETPKDKRPAEPRPETDPLDVSDMPAKPDGESEVKGGASSAGQRSSLITICYTHG